MRRYISKSLWFLFFSVVICCLIYPAVLCQASRQTLFPFQANGSILQGPDGKAVGSLLVAQPFTKDEYFQPRPSAASYDRVAHRPPRPWLGIQLYVAQPRGQCVGADRQIQRAGRAKGPGSWWRRTSRPGSDRIGSGASRTSWPSGRICITPSPKRGSMPIRRTGRMLTTGRRAMPAW